MKHLYLFLGLVLFSFISCDNEINPLQPQAEEACIRFDVIEEEWPTKGTTTDGTTIKNQSLGVLAYNITESNTMENSTPSLMYNIPVSMTDGSWTYNDVKKWPASGTVNFFAYTPYDNQESSGVTPHCVLSEQDKTGYPIITYRTVGDSNQLDDFLVASCLNRTKTDGTVRFSFQHALARLRFSAKLAEECDYSNVVITQVIVEKNSFDNYGQLVFTDQDNGFTWQNVKSDENKADILVPYGEMNHQTLNTTDFQSISAKDHGVFIIPQTTALSLKVYYTFTDQGGVLKSGVSVCPVNRMTYESGKTYNCCFTLTPKELEVIIPEGYERLEALRNNSYGCILLDARPDENTGAKMRIRYNQTGENKFPLGIISSESNNFSKRWYFVGPNQGSYQIGWGDYYCKLRLNESSNFSNLLNQDLVVTFNYLNNKQVLMQDKLGSSLSDHTSFSQANNTSTNTQTQDHPISEILNTPVNSNLPMTLFAVTRMSTGNDSYAVDYYCLCTIYEVWISSYGVDSYHYVPVRRKSDQKLGMYDLIGGQFKQCNHSAYFTAIPLSTGEATTE